jgi:hypothetical protein
MKTNYVNTRNWQMFLRKRIARLISKGWKPEEISETFRIPESLVNYHVEHMTVDSRTLMIG